MKVQYITNSGYPLKGERRGCVISSLANPQSFDSFDINVIDLNYGYIWKNKKASKTSLNCITDLINLGIMINNSKKTKVIIVFPQNCTYEYNASGSKYYENCELKNMLSELCVIMHKLQHRIKDFELVFEPTKTDINGIELSADFYFKAESREDVLLLSKDSEKATSIEENDIVYTTLKMEDFDSIFSFIDAVKIVPKYETAPEWFHEVHMFNDADLEKEITDCKKVISEQEKVIQIANDGLKENNYYKSALYEQGDKLVEIVFGILNEMLGFDLSEFVDIKKADYIYETEKLSFVGEIKGISSNVKKQNITQLETHCDDYIEEHPEKDGKVVAWLIINHQRTKPLNEREPVHKDVIGRAVRNNALIVETELLLKLFEKYKNGEKTSEDCLSLLSGKTGILTVDDIK